MSAWKELAVTVSSAEPTELAVSLVFVVQSPWAGLFVPNATVEPEVGRAVVVVEVDVDVDVDEDGLVEQAETEAKPAVTTSKATAPDQLRNERPMETSSAAPAAHNRDLRQLCASHR